MPDVNARTSGITSVNTSVNTSTLITRPCPFTPYDDVCFLILLIYVNRCWLILWKTHAKGQSGGHHKLSLLLLATYQKHFPAKFDRTDVHLSKLMHRNRWAEKCPQTTSWRRYRHRYYVAHLLLPMWYVKRHRKCFMTMLDLYKKTRNHEMVSREWSVECSSKFPLISIRLPIPATSDVAAAFSTVDDSVFAILYLPAIVWRSTDADSYFLYLFILFCVSCACHIFYKNSTHRWTCAPHGVCVF